MVEEKPRLTKEEIRKRMEFFTKMTLEERHEFVDNYLKQKNT
jgi:hypothetical protein